MNGCVKIAAGAAILLLGAGCDVRSGAWAGKRIYLHETRTGRAYWLYLPVQYVPEKRYPLVVTLHGMKPFDNAVYQINEWQIDSTADKYGLIVAAPVLKSPDLLGEFPLKNPQNSSLRKDERAIYNIVQEVCRNCSVDQDQILLTSWSSGGYILHYMLNRYPELFSAAVARQSNFHPGLLITGNAARYSRKPIYIFYGQNDFPAVKREGKESIEWYKQHGFKNLKVTELAEGHRRHPEMAAEFFRETMGRSLDRIQIVVSPPHRQGVPSVVSLTVRVPPDLGPVTEYLWLLGKSADPKPTNQPNTSWLVTETGEHPVEVIVTAGGKRYKSKTVVVVEARPPAQAQPPVTGSPTLGKHG